MSDSDLDPFDPVSDFDPAYDPYHFSDADVTRSLSSFRTDTATKINRGLEANPDDAAEATQLSDITGVPAQWTLNNLDEQREQVQKQTAQHIIFNNPELVAYLQSHPMAASVSNDDWANLDQLSQDSSAFAKLYRMLHAPFAALGEDEIGKSELEGAEAGWQGADFSSEYAKYTDPRLTGYAGAAAASLGFGAINLFLKTMGAGFGAAVGAARGVGTVIGGESLGREAGAMAEYEFMRGDHELIEGEGRKPEQIQAEEAFKQARARNEQLKHEGFIQLSPVEEAITKASKWWEAELEPPIGEHPLIDDAKAKLNEQALDLLDKAFKSADGTFTKERSRKLIQSFLDQHHEGQTFTIDSDAVVALYEGKEPAPDDKLLGWIPDIDAQLAAARETGQNVTVKITDWLAANVDPSVAKTLHDDIRMWPGGITANEAKEPIPPKEVVDAPLPQVRASAGLEPKFSMGDRKLTLEPKLSVEGEDTTPSIEEQLARYAKPEGPAGKAQGSVSLDLREKLPEAMLGDTRLPEAHNYNILDEQGKRVGDLGIALGKDKTLIVEWVGGQGGLWSNSFGPSLIRDIKRQLKAMYPEYDSIAGFRVSGARDKAGALGVAKVKLAADADIDPADYARMQEIFQQGWQRYNDHLNIKPIDGAGTPEQHYLANIAIDEIQRITGGRANIIPTAGIHREGTKVYAAGAYVPSRDTAPDILFNIMRPDVVGVGRHESVHFLRDYNFFKPEEWATLESAAKSEGWLDRYGINQTYAHLNESERLEEAIAQGFREWARQAPEIRPKTGVGAVFQKIMDLFDAIKTRLGFGKDATWEEVFAKVHSGEVIGREPGAPRTEGAYDLRLGEPLDKFSIEKESKEEQPLKVNENANEWILYHGTTKEAFTNFDPNAVGDRSSVGASRPGTFFSPSSKTASGYAGEYGHVYKTKVTPGKTKVFDVNKLKTERWFRQAYEDQSIEDAKRSGWTPEALKNLKEGFEESERNKEYLRDDWGDETSETIVLLGYKEGLDTSIIRNLPTEDEGRDQIVVYNPDMIKPFWDKPAKRISSIEGDTALRAESVGLRMTSFERLQKAYQEKNAADIEASIKHAQKIEARNQSAEWRSNRADMAKEVAAEIRQRPDIAADAFVGSGELAGAKLKQRFTLLASDLTPEQRAMLPDHYTSKDGLPADVVAGMFGYGTKDELVQALADVNTMRKAADADKTSRRDFLSKLVQQETDRRMVARYGDKDDNVMFAAIDHALSDNNINVMYEELYSTALEAGKTVFDKDILRATAQRIVNSRTAYGNGLNSWRLMQDLDRWSRATREALINKNFAEAAVAMQKQVVGAMIAKEARKVEKEVKAFERDMKTNAKRVRASIAPEYLDRAHSIMVQIGKPVKRGAADLAREINAAGSKTLQEWVAERVGRLQVMPVWDQLYDSTWQKNYKDLTVEEFRYVRDSLKAIITNGREELKLIRQGNKIDFDVGISQLTKALEQFDRLPIDKTVGINVIAKTARGYYARTLQVENILDRWDRWNPKGPWSQMVFRDMIEAANQSDAWRKEAAQELRALDDKVDLTKPVSGSPFIEPEEHGGRQIPATRETLRTVMLNLGTDSNLKKLAKGYGLNPAVIESWVHANADAADWKFVRGVWDIFRELKDRSDEMYRRQSSVPAESIEGRTIRSPKFGKIDGGYYPLFRHEIYAPAAPKTIGELMGEGFESATPPASYTKSRTEVVYPLALNMDRMANRMTQMIHDTAVRPAVVNANKIFRDPKIKGAIVSRLGKEYHDMMMDWVKGVANASNSVQKEGAWLRPLSDFMRTNVMSALIGFNPATWLKHGLTAGGLSMKEVGRKAFLEAFGDTAPEHVRIALHSLFNVNDETADSNYHFAMGSSMELQRRERNTQENIYNAAQELIRPKTRWGRWRDALIEKGSAPIAFSDKLSSVPTWLAKYREQMANGEAHGDAVAAADKAVRRAHGSTSIAARPLIMQSISPWFTTFYNFFNDVFNRQVETLWRAGDILKLNKEGRQDEAMKQAGMVAAGMFAYAVWPALTEAWTSPEDNSEKDSWAWWAAKAMFRTEGATLPVVREFTNGILRAKDPDVGLMTTEFKSLVDLIRDTHKQAPFSPAHAEKMIRDGGELLGVLMGMPEQAARTASGIYGYAAGVEHPRGPWDWGSLAWHGTLKRHR